VTEESVTAPIHIEETILSIGRLNAEHHANATQHQCVVDRVTSLLGRPAFLVTLTAAILGWVATNALAGAFDLRAPDPPPFRILTGARLLGLGLTPAKSPDLGWSPEPRGRAPEPTRRTRRR
jgi:uncharacterized membrane protein